METVLRGFSIAVAPCRNPSEVLHWLQMYVCFVPRFGVNDRDIHPRHSFCRSQFGQGIPALRPYHPQLDVEAIRNETNQWQH